MSGTPQPAADAGRGGLARAALRCLQRLALALRRPGRWARRAPVPGHAVVAGARVAYGDAAGLPVLAIGANADRIPLQFRLARQPRFLEIARCSGLGRLTGDTVS